MLKYTIQRSSKLYEINLFIIEQCALLCIRHRVVVEFIPVVEVWSKCLWVHLYILGSSCTDFSINNSGYPVWSMLQPEYAGLG